MARQTCDCERTHCDLFPWQHTSARNTPALLVALTGSAEALALFDLGPEGALAAFKRRRNMGPYRFYSTTAIASRALVTRVARSLLLLTGIVEPAEPQGTVWFWSCTTTRNDQVRSTS